VRAFSDRPRLPAIAHSPRQLPRLWHEIARHALGPDLEPAIRQADRQVMRQWPHAGVLVKNTCRWRAEPATEKQCALLAQKGFPPHALATLTKGDAARAISWVLEQGGAGRR
jgi:hypothetical protein